MNGNGPPIPVHGRHVSVLIASLGRPSLLRTLDSVDAAIVPEGVSVDVVIVDDSVDGHVGPLLAGRSLRHPLRIVGLGARNVASARNALLDAATGDWGLFVDDDEHVEENWLAGHLRAATAFNADAVFGPVRFIYPNSAPDWFKGADMLWHDLGWSDNGREVSTGATGNTLIRMATIRRLGLRFDLRFGRSGGEDTDFFNRLSAAGGKMVLTDWAKAWEHVPEARASSAYILERSARAGQSYAMQTLEGASPIRRFNFTINALGKLALASAAAMLAWPFGPVWRCRFQAMACSNVGKLKTVFGGRGMDGWANEV